MNPFEFTKELISIPSVTGTEGRIGEFLSARLESLGYRVKRQDVTNDRFNVFAFAGEAGEGRVMFCTHIDTVPAPSLPIVPREDSEFIYGRGACDTKGIIAAMLETGNRLRDSGVTDFGYMFLVGEET